MYEAVPDRFQGIAGTFSYVACADCGLVQRETVTGDVRALYEDYPLHDHEAPLYRKLRSLTIGHCYLDVPYAEPSADAAQAARQGRVGLRFYAPRTVEESFHWEPADALGAGRGAHVAGVEAAVWAETITGFDDLSFLLLPRLPGVAHKAWGARATSWTDHRDRLARHGRLWAQDDLTYFRTTTVDWP